MRTRIDVSPEMVSFVGSGDVPPDGWPDGPVALSLDTERGTIRFHADAGSADASADLVLVVAEAACRRLFDALPGDGLWHMPIGTRTVALALRDCSLPEPARTTLRLAKSIELLCAAFGDWRDGAAVPAGPAAALSATDTRRLVAARRIIHERCNEKLTLDAVARAAGLNRAKLTRGFRTLFQCSVADAITEQRLLGARDLLLATDLPVASVGYRCGYLNNASFTRAFSRRFGAAPSRLRGAGAAA